MHVQHQKGIPLTIPKDPVDVLRHTLWEKKNTIIPFFTYSHCKETNTYLLPL